MIKYFFATLLLALSPGVWHAGQGETASGRPARVSEFPELPADVAKDLTHRGCRIPQVQGVSKRHNVLQGEFAKSGQHDWVVLCLQNNTSIIIVYWNGAVRNPAQLAPLDETLTPSKNGYYRILRVVGEKFIRAHYDASAAEMDPLPKVLDHDAIDDGIFEKGSSVHYYDNGKWLTLAGSD